MARMQGRSIQPGDDVYGADGEKIGTVGAVTSSYLMVEKGFFFRTDSYIPREAIASTDDGKVYLTVTREQALAQGWEVAPSREPASVTTISRPEPFTGGDTDAVIVPVYHEEMTVTKIRREVGGTRIDRRVVADARTLDAPVTELRLMVVRREVNQPIDATGADVLEEVIVDVPLRAEDITRDPEGRHVEEIAIWTEVTGRVERVSVPLRREHATVTEMTEGVVIDQQDTEGRQRSSR